MFYWKILCLCKYFIYCGSSVPLFVGLTLLINFPISTNNSEQEWFNFCFLIPLNKPFLMECMNIYMYECYSKRKWLCCRVWVLGYNGGGRDNAVPRWLPRWVWRHPLSHGNSQLTRTMLFAPLLLAYWYFYLHFEFCFAWITTYRGPHTLRKS